MNTHYTKSIGYHAAGASYPENPTPLGIYTPFHGSPGKLHRQKVGPDGNIIDFDFIGPVPPSQIVETETEVLAQVGSPHLLALVVNSKDPKNVTVLPWPKMTEKLLQAYLTMRDELMKYPVAGHKIANLVLALAPRYAAAAGPGVKVDFTRFGPEIDLIAADDDHFYRRSPQVRQLAKEAGVDLKPHRDDEMLP